MKDVKQSRLQELEEMNKQLENINKKITEKLTSEEHEHNLLKAKQEELIAKTEYRR